MSTIVILDGNTANPGDLSWEPIEKHGKLMVYARTNDQQLIDRASPGDILVVNKRKLGKEALRQLPNLKCICTLATGYNNVDVNEARNQDVIVCNAVGYSSPSVAQHVFSLILELTNNVGTHSLEVDNGGWAKSIDWCFWSKPLWELHGKTLGIYGYGKIGQEVAKIGRAFGMRIITLSRGKEKDIYKNVEYVQQNELFSMSDVLSLHAPLTTDNQNFINKETLKIMQKTALLINTGRGGLVEENDLKEALLTQMIAGAGLDVLSLEPPSSNHILLNTPNCIITPHIAWASIESRRRLVAQVGNNIQAFLEGKPTNVVN